MAIDLTLISVYSYDSDEIDSQVDSLPGDSKYIKVCKYCGKKFVATPEMYGRNYGRVSSCKRSHYSRCKICNTEFLQDSAIKVGTKLNEVCSSKECRNKLSGLKSKKAIQKKYGVDNPFQIEAVKQKSRETCLQRYGVEYYGQSDQYRDQIQSIWGQKSDDERKEIEDRRRQTCIDRYGVDNPRKVKGFQDKSKETCLERYGVEFVSQSKEFRQSVSDTWSNKTREELDEIINKRIKTTREKYGVDYACQDPIIRQRLIDALVNKSDEEKADIRARTIQTNLKRYGTAFPAENEDVQVKARQTTFDRFGVEYIFHSQEFQEHTRQIMRERYGVENALQHGILREKGKQTSLKKYGTEYPMQSEEMRKRVSLTRIQHYADTIDDPIARRNYLAFMNDPIDYVLHHFDHVPTYSEIEQSIGNRCSCTIYEKVPTSLGIVDQSSSSMESELVRFLQSLDENIVIHKHDHTIIKPLELDIYLPDYDLAIECNPTYTHNSSIPSFSNSEPISYLYHKNKTDLCEQQGIFLFHIFGYEWNHRKDIIKSMVQNLLNLNSTRYYARQLKIVELSAIEAKSFLDRNHRQGGVNSSVRLGLKTSEGQLISCMTFGKVRSTIGSATSANNWELVRFCNRLNTSVVGGASKLFKYFINNYNYDRIISFSDRSHTRGNLYEILGFKLSSQSSPGYVWVSTKDDRYYNRVTCQKQNLRNLFKDDTIDIKNKTEKQIMVEHGYVQVYDSGSIRWEFTVPAIK